MMMKASVWDCPDAGIATSSWHGVGMSPPFWELLIGVVVCNIVICVIIKIDHEIIIKKHTEFKIKHGHETLENIMISLCLLKSLCSAF